MNKVTILKMFGGILILLCAVLAFTFSILGRNEDINLDSDFVFDFNSVTNQLQPIPETPGIQRDLAVREMLLKHVIEENINAIKMNRPDEVTVVFIDFGNRKDPPDNFIDRFKNMEIPVKKISQARINDYSSAIDKESGNRGVIVSAKIIKWIDRFTAKVECSFYAESEWGYGNTMIIREKNGKWGIIHFIGGWNT